MNYSKLSIQNFGPVETGTINNEKITVFFGPNNSGKSIISKIIHAISLFDPSPDAQVTRAMHDKKPEITIDRLMTFHVLHNLGLSHSAATTYNKSKSTITIENRKKTHQLTISDPIKKQEYIIGHVRYYRRHLTKSTLAKRSVYIPAGRTGTIQFFYSIAQMRNRLLNDILASFASYGDIKNDFSARNVKDFLQSTGSFPDFMNEFYDTVLSAYAKGVTKNFQDMFQTLFSGQVYTKKGVMPSMIFEDTQGFPTDIENAGSGVISSLPILLGVDYVKNGGSLIIEEPEAHMEPARQYKLMEILYEVSKTKKTKLFLTTHSDYVVKKLLSMVSQKRLKPSDLGLYYFKRAKNKYTQIQKMTIDRSGEAEQPIFQDALETMMQEFSK